MEIPDYPSSRIASVTVVRLIRVETTTYPRVVDYFTEDSIHVARVTEWCGAQEEPLTSHDLKPPPCSLVKGHLGAHGYEDGNPSLWDGTGTRYRRKHGR